MHVPSALCMRGTMLLHGDRACDGRIDEKRCAQCWSEFRGVPSSLAYAMSHLPRMSFEILGSTNKVVSRAVTLLTARARVLVQAHELQQMVDLSEMIVAPSAWVHSGLLANGIAPAKLSVSRQGVTTALTREAAATPREPPGDVLRVGFIGRLEHYKGAHVLIDAMSRLPRNLPIHLMIAGSGTEPGYLRQLTQAWGGDKRIEFLGSISRGQVPDFMRKLDVLAVPSNYMETGPLVVLEAQVFGIPVMGADIGGISERIRDGVDGWLLPFSDPGAWAAALQEAATDRARLARYAANIGRTRTMGDVADDMAGVYRDILAARPAQA
jgi:glycosyltransferase involved in cell wall biosynthesis